MSVTHNASWRAGYNTAQAEMRDQLDAAKMAIDVLKGDLALAGEHEQAAIAAALRGISDMVRLDEELRIVNPDVWDRQDELLYERILALITPEAQSALDRHDAELFAKWRARLDHCAKLDLLRAVRDEAEQWRPMVREGRAEWANQRIAVHEYAVAKAQSEDA
jgi:hypothetical protein